MITQDDIDAFYEENKEAMHAADEYVRRCDKGLPADRYTDGTIGDRRVARGISAYKQMVSMFADAWVWKLHEEHKRGAEAMEPSRDPMR